MRFLSIILFLSCICCKSPRHDEVISFTQLAEKRLGVHNPEPIQNPSSVLGVALGKKLFFDPLLSKNNSISCATCHHQNLAFSDGISLTSVGVSGKQLLRNSPSLQNLAWQNSFFWEGGAANLESQALGPLTNPDEMGMDLLELEKILNASPNYRKDFKSVFGTDSIKTAHVQRALAQFERSLISCSSKYDMVKEGKAIFSALEKTGYSLFQQKCVVCHSEPLFTDNKFHNNGLDFDLFFVDDEDLRWGRYRVTLKDIDIGKYKTPSLRNCMVSAPYMHDARFQNIENVLDHYATAIKPSKTLDIEIPKDGFLFSTEDKKALTAFLHTLTDEDFLSK